MGKQLVDENNELAAFWVCSNHRMTNGRIIDERLSEALLATWLSQTLFKTITKSMQDFLSTLTSVHDFSYGFKESLAEPGG